MSLFIYARELVGKSLAELVKEGNLNQRLQKAASEFVLAPVVNLPDDVKSLVETLQSRLTAKDKTVKEVVASMSSTEAAEVSSHILTIYRQMWLHTGRKQ